MSNAGPDEANNAVVTDTLSAGVVYESAVAPQGSCEFNAPTVSCDLGTINDSANATVTIVVTPESPGMVSNTASVDSDANDTNRANNSAEVLVTISCTTGLILEQSKPISESAAVTFIVTEFDSGELKCTITEEVPTGYVPDYFDGSTNSSDGCTFEAIVGNPDFTGEITNSPAPVELEIGKPWIFEGSASGVDTRFELHLECTEVIPGFPNSVCSVEEVLFDDAVEVENGCQEIFISAGQGANCVVINTVFFEGIPALAGRGLAVLTLLMLGLGAFVARRTAT